MLDEFIWIKRNEYSIVLKYNIDDQIDFRCIFSITEKIVQFDIAIYGKKFI